MITPTNHLAALIRAQLATQVSARNLRRQSPGTGGSDAVDLKAPDRTGEAGTAQAHESDDGIRQLVARRVAALSIDDPHRARKAARLFLEGVMMQEFGRAQLDDVALTQIVDAVMQRMEVDTELSAALHEAGGLLLADPGTAHRAL